jgi:hypothetical protein
VRHRAERGQQHKDCDENQNWIGYAVKKTQHNAFTDESFKDQFLTRININCCQSSKHHTMS